MNYIAEIKNYILFLKNKCNLSITLHPYGDERLISSSELMAFNIHDNSYCIYIKTHPDAYLHCTQCQKKIISKLGNESFCGVCYAGVKEYVYPIFNGEHNVGFLCMSGYMAENASSYINSVSDRFAIKKDSLESMYAALKSNIPAVDAADVLIKPLLRMLELAYIKLKSERYTDETFINTIIHYIELNHTRSIGIEEICSKYSCSRSYVSHEFKKRTGKSFNEFINDIRIRDAKLLLLNSNLSITEIAYSVGFNDSNYFSVVFKKMEGMSPGKYRREHKKSRDYR